MINLTLLVKSAASWQLKKVEETFMEDFEDLSVEVKFNVNPAKWVTVSLSGEDETIAANFVKKKIGTAPEKLENIKYPATLKGVITKIDPDQQQMRVDVGVFHPKTTQAVVSSAELKAQLGGGKNYGLEEMARLFGLLEGVTVSVEVTELGADGFAARLSAEQVERLRVWRQSLLDRLLVLRVPLDELETVLDRSRMGRDVVGVESMGLFEHVVTCKLGTDAAGLIPRVGRFLRNARFVVFSPKRFLVQS
jgi:hypothetical protein